MLDIKKQISRLYDSVRGEKTSDAAAYAAIGTETGDIQ